MRRQGTGGKIISAASIAGPSGFAYLGPYSATTFGVVGLTQAAAKELAADRIRVDSYCPGIVGTDMWDLIDEKLGAYLGLGKGEALQQYAAGILLGRVQTPDDVAGFVSYLAGPGLRLHDRPVRPHPGRARDALTRSTGPSQPP
jgi:meso-butanediol dehydrogenase / (S,S)-butanediol dehydrogenase / diacetyl reductase